MCTHKTCVHLYTHMRTYANLTFMGVFSSSSLGLSLVHRAGRRLAKPSVPSMYSLREVGNLFVRQGFSGEAIISWERPGFSG